MTGVAAKKDVWLCLRVTCYVYPTHQSATTLRMETEAFSCHAFGMIATFDPNCFHVKIYHNCCSYLLIHLGEKQTVFSTAKHQFPHITPEPNTYDNPLGLQDLPRSKSDAHVDPTKESVQTTKET